MKERPILFSAPMVRALLAGDKTQTRRLMKVPCQELIERDDGSLWPWSEHPEKAGDLWHPCPYGRAGDRLWVKETHMAWWKIDPENPDGPRLFSHVAAFAADGYQLEHGERWIPSIHMRRAASRLLLEITGVRVERLQDISEQDAIAEGIPYRQASDWMGPGGARRDFGPVDAFRELWESINGAGSWEANSWVWVVEFRRIEP